MKQPLQRLSLALLFTQCLALHIPSTLPLQHNNACPRKVIGSGVKLRILPTGDSITVGWLSDDHNGYREKLRQNLANNNNNYENVVFAGTERYGNMEDAYHAAWSGKTIQFINDHVDAALEQRPNLILLHAGTNDMNINLGVSVEGRDPSAAAERLGNLIDKMVQKCPDAVILVAVIINTCRADQSPQTKQYQALIPNIIETRAAANKHVLAVDFTKFPTSLLRDCIHPTDLGYRVMGDWWYDFITQIPSGWLAPPIGPDPFRNSNSNSTADANR